MKLRRFKIEKEWIHNQEAVIKDPGEIRHIVKVLRLRPGDRIVLFDGEGREYPATIATLAAREIFLSLPPEPAPEAKELPLKIILGVGLLKSFKFDGRLQKATELGVSEIVPFYSLRVVPRLEESKILPRKARWGKIILEAAKQCGQAKVPTIRPLCSFAEALQKKVENAVNIILWEKEKTGKLKDVLAPPVSTIYALVGPEGGFSDQEAIQAQEAGFRAIRLGPRILRAETAGIVLAGLLQFFYGDLK